MKIVSIQLEQSESDKPIYIRLAEAIESMLGKGELKNGEMLPPVRKLARNLSVSISTVVAAYKRLEDTGLVYTKPGSGTYCLPQDGLQAGDTPEPVLPITRIIETGHAKFIINLAESTPGTEVFPVKEFKAALNHVLDSEGGNVFSYQESEGFYGLRQAVCRFAGKYLSVNCSPEDILITSGAQQAIDLISKVLLNANDIVLTENPTYPGARSIFTSRRSKVIGIPMEKDGINLELFKYNIKRYRPCLVYIMPIYQTPTGGCISAQKRRELLELADKYDFHILEEDTFSELALNGPRLCPLKSEDASDRVIYVKSFSKIIMPGIRTGFIIAPRSITNAIARAKYMTDISASGLVQRALGYYLDSGAWDSHIDNVLSLYKNRFKVASSNIGLLEELGATVEKPDGGLGLWVRLPKIVKDYELQESCFDRGVMLAPGSPFFVTPMQDCENYIRITYSASSCEDIEKGLAVAADSLKRILNRKSKKVFYI